MTSFFETYTIMIICFCLQVFWLRMRKCIPTFITTSLLSVLVAGAGKTARNQLLFVVRNSARTDIVGNKSVGWSYVQYTEMFPKARKLLWKLLKNNDYDLSNYFFQTTYHSPKSFIWTRPWSTAQCNLKKKYN